MNGVGATVGWWMPFGLRVVGAYGLTSCLVTSAASASVVAVSVSAVRGVRWSECGELSLDRSVWSVAISGSASGE